VNRRHKQPPCLWSILCKKGNESVFKRSNWAFGDEWVAMKEARREHSRCSCERIIMCCQLLSIFFNVIWISSITKIWTIINSPFNIAGMMNANISPLLERMRSPLLESIFNIAGMVNAKPSARHVLFAWMKPIHFLLAWMNELYPANIGGSINLRVRFHGSHLNYYYYSDQNSREQRCDCMRCD
jgi:hypothetical protein